MKIMTVMIVMIWIMWRYLSPGLFYIVSPNVLIFCQNIHHLWVPKMEYIVCSNLDMGTFAWDASATNKCMKQKHNTSS